MKRFLLWPLLFLVLTSCEKPPAPPAGAISVGEYTGRNKLLGIGRIGDVAYHCTVDPGKVEATGKWDFGTEEPPLGPNKAMAIAHKALQENFPAIKTFKPDVITLVRFKEGAVYQAIFNSAAERAIGEGSDMTNYMYIYVYMDGTTEIPAPAPPGG